MTLSDQVGRGAAWAFGGEVARQLTRLIVGIVLARILVPSDFGLAAMAMFVVEFIQVFVNSGVTQAAIQKEDVTPDDWSSIFWVGVALGTVAGSVAWALGPIAASFYHDERVIPIIRLAGSGALVASFGATQAAWFGKQMQFRTIAEVESAGTLTGGTVAITMAATGWGVWSIVSGSLASRTTVSLLLHLRCPWRPGLKLRTSTLRWALRFGIGLQGFGIINYLHRRLDDAVVGRYVGAVGLGYYDRAYQLMLYPVGSIAGVAGSVLFPALSKIGDDLPRLRSAYLRSVAAIATATFPVMLGLLVTAPEVIVVVYGIRWMPAVPVLQVLCVVGLIQSVVTTVGWIYLARGRTDILFAWGVGATIVICSSFFLGLPWGIMGVAVAYALANGVLLVPALSIPFRLIGLTLVDLLKAIQGVLTGAVLMAGIVALVRAGMLAAEVRRPLVLAATVSTGILSYTAWLRLTDSDAFRQARQVWSRSRLGPGFINLRHATRSGPIASSDLDRRPSPEGPRHGA